MGNSVLEELKVRRFANDAC